MMTKWWMVAAAALGCVVQVQAQTTWQRTYGGYSTDEGNGVLVNSEGNYLIVGSTGSFGAGGGDVYVLLLDPAGQKIWSTTLGGVGVEQGRQAVEASDGGYVIVGSTNSSGSGGYDGYVVKIDAMGTPVWERTFGGADWDFLYSIGLSDDGGYVVAGQTHSAGNGGGDAWVLKLDASGIMEWERTYGSDEEDFARSIIPTMADGYMFAGGTSAAMDQNAWLVHLDSTGEVIWDVEVGGDSLDYANAVIQTADGGFAAVGVTKSFSTYTEALHFKVDGSGASIWTEHFLQGTGEEYYGIVELADGGLVAVGYVDGLGSGGKDIYMLFTDGSGAFISGVTNGGDNGAGDEVGQAVTVLPNGGCLVVGYTESFGFGVRDVYVVRTDSVGWTESTVVETHFDPLEVSERISDEAVKVFPNLISSGGLLHLQLPSSAAATARIKDVRGGHIAHVALPKGGRTSIRVPELAPGAYLISIVQQGRGPVVSRFFVVD